MTPAGSRGEPEPASYYDLLARPISGLRAFASFFMCGAVGFHEHAVPWYCGPVAEGESEGGYKTVCKGCHDKWAEWDDSLRYYGA